MLCTHLGCIEIEAYRYNFPNMGGSKNRPIEVPLLKARFEWKIVKMVDFAGIIRFDRMWLGKLSKEASCQIFVPRIL